MDIKKRRQRREDNLTHGEGDCKGEMAEAPQQQQQQQEEGGEKEEEQQQQSSPVEKTEPDEGAEEPKEIAQTTPSRPLLSMRSMSSVDPDDDTPNMIVYRKVRASIISSIFLLTYNNEFVVLVDKFEPVAAGGAADLRE